MILTDKQEQAVKIAVQRYKDGEKYTIISGYAGSGKTVAIKHIIEALPKINPEKDVVYTAYTGKAAQVLFKKGNKNVSTLHKLLFESKPLPNGKFIRKPVSSIPYKIVVVDEVSMPDSDLMKRLFSYNVHIICCGDPAQLPPVSKNSSHHLLEHPHIFLDEIMRQSQESEIIRLTMDIREGKAIKPFKGKEINILNKSELNVAMLNWADQVICATNKTRHELNTLMRKKRGIESNIPVDGDKMICTRNYWNDSFGCEEPLINGTIGYLKNSFETYHQLPYRYGSKKVPIIRGNLNSDIGVIFKELNIDKEYAINEKHTLDSEIVYKIGKDWKSRWMIPLDLTYGYAITCHKSQGSSWSKVLVIEENFPFDRTEHKKWLYTACTRPEDKLVIILNN